MAGPARAVLAGGPAATGRLAARGSHAVARASAAPRVAARLARPAGARNLAPQLMYVLTRRVCVPAGVCGLDPRTQRKKRAKKKGAAADAFFG